jgi:hypothetical protein
MVEHRAPHRARPLVRELGRYFSGARFDSRKRLQRETGSGRRLARRCDQGSFACCFAAISRRTKSSSLSAVRINNCASSRWHFANSGDAGSVTDCRRQNGGVSACRRAGTYRFNEVCGGGGQPRSYQKAALMFAQKFGAQGRGSCVGRSATGDRGALLPFGEMPEPRRVGASRTVGRQGNWDLRGE